MKKIVRLIVVIVGFVFLSTYFVNSALATCVNGWSGSGGYMCPGGIENCQSICSGGSCNQTNCDAFGYTWNQYICSGCSDCAAAGGCPLTQSGSTCTSYSSSAPSCGTTCTSRTSTCDDGVWDLTPYTYSSCTTSCCASNGCSQTNNGQTCTSYFESVPSGACNTSCTSKVSTCNSTSWSSTPYNYSSCTVDACLSCDLPWGGSIAHGASVPAYSQTTALAPDECSDYSITRTCSDGTLSGSSSYQYSGCTDQNECSFPDTMAMGGTKTISTSCSIGAYSNYITGVEDSNTSATDASNSASIILDGSTLTIGSANNQTLLFGQVVLTSTRFSTKQSYYTWTDDPSDNVATGDLNGDGSLDIVTGGAASIKILLNNGDGTFGNVSFATGSAATTTNGPYLSDLDGDGDLDILQGSSTYLDILLNNGNGTFAANASYSAGATITDEMAIDDFNGDGRDDVVFGGGAEGIKIFINNGNGTFGTVTTKAGSAATADGPAIGDANGDGNMDILQGAGSNIDVFIGNGNGTFNNASSSAMGYTIEDDFRAADLNGDNRVDVVTGESGTGADMKVSLNNGAGGFSTATQKNGPGGLSTTDFGPYLWDVNGDGDLDIVQGVSSSIYIYTNQGNGLFNNYDTAPLSAVSAGGNLGGGITMGDVSGDGILDLIIGISNTSNGPSVRINKGDGTFYGVTMLIDSGTSIGPVLADVNNDGKLDIVSASTGNNIDIFWHKPKASIVIAKGVGAQMVKGVRWVQDSDADTYPNSANSATVAAGLRPDSTYVRKNYISGNYSKTDCASADANKWQNFSGFVDSDGDSYGVSATITRRASSMATKAYAAGNSYVINKPTGTAQNDLMIAAMYLTQDKTVATPAGWNILFEGTGTNKLMVYYRIAGASEGASYTFTLNGATSIAGGIVSYYNIDTTNPFDIVNWQATASGPSFTAPSITTTGAQEVVMSIHAADVGTPNADYWVTPSGMAEIAETYINDTYDPTISFNDVAQDTAGASGNKTATGDETAAMSGASMLLSIRPSGLNSSVCSGSSLASGYIVNTLNGVDCNDTSASAWRNRYRDADGDTYGVAAATCVGNDAGYVDSPNTDCYDSGTNAAAAHPGQATYQTAARGDGSWDFDCDTTSGEKNPTYNCTSTYLTSCSTTQMPGYTSGAIPACGASGTFYGVYSYSSSLNCTFNNGPATQSVCGTPSYADRKSYSVGSVTMGCL